MPSKPPISREELEKLVTRAAQMRGHGHSFSDISAELGVSKVKVPRLLALGRVKALDNPDSIEVLSTPTRYGITAAGYASRDDLRAAVAKDMCVLLSLPGFGEKRVEELMSWLAAPPLPSPDTSPKVAKVGKLWPHLATRSQARELALVLPSEGEVILDFSGVKRVEEAFVDELFTRWRSRNPDAQLRVTGATVGVSVDLPRDVAPDQPPPAKPVSTALPKPRLVTPSRSSRAAA